MKAERKKKKRIKNYMEYNKQKGNENKKHRGDDEGKVLVPKSDGPTGAAAK